MISIRELQLKVGQKFRIGYHDLKFFFFFLEMDSACKNQQGNGNEMEKLFRFVNCSSRLDKNSG